MSELKPTDYGPVGTKTDEGGKAEDSQTQGSLAVLVQQPTNSQIQFGTDGVRRYVEVWKGPYSVIKEIVDHDYEGFKAYVIGQERPTQPEEKIVQRFTPPDPGQITVNDETTDLKWLVESVDVEQLEAGDHANMTVTYANILPGSSGGGGGGGEASPAIDRTTWQLKYQPYSRNILAYCSKTAHPPKYVKLVYKDAKGKDDPPKAGTVVNTAYAKNILDYVQHRADTFENADNFADAGKYQWSQNGVICELNDSEKSIAEKYLRNNYATFHHPVIYKTHTKVFSFSSTDYHHLSVASTSSFFDVSEGIDKIENPKDCPYTTVLQKYKWLRVADDVQVDYENDGMKATHSECWEGYLAIDTDLYGDNAWKPDSK